MGTSSFPSSKPPTEQMITLNSELLVQKPLGWGIKMTRVVAISFSRGSFPPRNWTWVSCIAGRFFTDWATREPHRPYTPSKRKQHCNTQTKCFPSEILLELPVCNFWLHTPWEKCFVMTIESWRPQCYKQVYHYSKVLFYQTTTYHILFTLLS